MISLIIAAGINAAIGRVLPMERAEEIFRAMREGEIHGKTVLTRWRTLLTSSRILVECQSKAKVRVRASRQRAYQAPKSQFIRGKSGAPAGFEPKAPGLS
jgi:hypothetical protein